ncbi:hypothetical protein MRB53_008674 [Persea americana]|uniref:Uncharacterized protein n=1 Tax=Persea americana TaxID=3435 RepID=A0ACC2MNC4_PERAE|nr:hypothetical protein MRB53_008674 [Persea americana]
MKISQSLNIFLFLLFIAVKEMVPVIEGANGIRPPEHTCRKVIGSGNFDQQKCLQECSKEGNGSGEWKEGTCFCIYYCQQPPL